MKRWSIHSAPCNFIAFNPIDWTTFSVYIRSSSCSPFILSDELTSKRSRAHTRAAKCSTQNSVLSLVCVRLVLVWCVRAYDSSPITSHFVCFTQWSIAHRSGTTKYYFSHTVQASSLQGTEALSVDFVFVVYTHREWMLFVVRTKCDRSELNYKRVERKETKKSTREAKFSAIL